MINAINPFCALPVYEKLEEQTAFRHGGPTQIVPFDRLIPFQITIPYDTETPIRTTLINVSGTYAASLQANIFRLYEMQEAGQYTLWFNPGVLAAPLECDEMYMAIEIGAKTYYTERFTTIGSPGERTTYFSLSVSGTDITFTPTDNAGAGTSKVWERLDENGLWVNIGSGDDITVPASTFWGVSPQTGTYKVRRVLTTPSGQRIVGLYAAFLQSSDLERSTLIRLPHLQRTDATDLYCLEYWNNSDKFGFVYEYGYKQRLYLHGTFDLNTAEEEDQFIQKPNGESDRRSGLNKPIQQFVCDNMPDYLASIIECACRHDNLRLIRQSDGVTFEMSEANFDPGQSDNPLAISGTISFVQNIIYRAGADVSLGARPITLQVEPPLGG